MTYLAENIDDVFDGMGDDANGVSQKHGVKLDDEDFEQADKLGQQEEKAAPRGYMTKEAWVESGKNPEDWVSEEVYKERGERIKQTAKLQKEHENQIKNLKLLHQVTLKNQREELLSKRDDYIEVADKAGVNAIDKKLAELDKLDELAKDDEQPKQSAPAEVLAWEAANPWCNDEKDSRLPLARRTYAAAINAGSDPTEALELVDIAIAKKFSSKPSKPAQIAESSRSTAASRYDSVEVSMKNLTRDEQ